MRSGAEPDGILGTTGGKKRQGGEGLNLLTSSKKDKDFRKEAT